MSTSDTITDPPDCSNPSSTIAMDQQTTSTASALEDRQRFVRHFLICGLDPNNADLETDETASISASPRLADLSSQAEFGGGGSLAAECNPLERSYKAKVLRMLPSPEKEWSNLNPEGLTGLILPQGQKIKFSPCLTGSENSLIFPQG